MFLFIQISIHYTLIVVEYSKMIQYIAPHIINGLL